METLPNTKQLILLLEFQLYLSMSLLDDQFTAPYIYTNKVNDFHIADTLGNTLGTLPTIFFLIAILSNDTTKGNYLIKLGTFSVVVFELAHPLLGKPIDIWDIIATIMTGFISYFIYNTIFKDKPNEQKTTNR